jgi:hypothetical protein
LSSVTVVGNSILLGRYKPRFAAERKIQVRKDNEKIYSDKDFKEVYAPKASS